MSFASFLGGPCKKTAIADGAKYSLVPGIGSRLGLSVGWLRK
ncbi:hypothetical protein SynMEDNS5_02687 [Synechococcus sp. MEDNS5]|nr:hypothetical protein SynMEDNS5_02687 [Synechococcus sp. MEDNS5]